MTTLLELRTRAKDESDNVGFEFIADPEWNRYINGSYGELYGLLAQKFGADYFVADPPHSFTTDGINSQFALPVDFFKLLGVDVLYGNANQWVSLTPFQFNQRNRFSWINSPIPVAGQQLRVWYVPRMLALTLDADSVADAVSINQWDEYIVVDACLKAIGKEESSTTDLLTRKAALEHRIEAEADNRDAGWPQRISNTNGIATPAMQYRLNGTKLWLIGYQAAFGWPGPDWDMWPGGAPGAW